MRNVLNRVVIAHAHALFYFRQRNYLEVVSFLEEYSAVVGKEIMENIYKLAVRQPHQFLYARLLRPM